MSVANERHHDDGRVELIDTTRIERSALYNEDSRGTWDAVRKARAAGIRVVIVEG